MSEPVPAGVPEIDLVDDTWIAAAPKQVADVVRDPNNWREWWPQSQLEVILDRGLLGVHWRVLRCDARPGHPTEGTQEIWLEPAFEGVVLHFFLRLRGLHAPLARPHARRLERDFALAAKRNFWAVKDRLEGRRT